MKKLLNISVQNKTAKGAYIIMCVSLLMTLFFTLIGKETFVEILGIVAFVSLTTGVVIDFLLILKNTDF